ncbi:MAG: efflux RND transporter periplasmic adaptor subunit [Vicinamibacterales bacterium]
MRPFFYLCIALAVAACGGGASQPEAAGAAFPPTDVQVVTMAPKPVPQTSEYVATIQSLRSTTVQPQVEGILRQIFVKAGDRVRAGQPLAQIDPDRQQASLTAAQAQQAAREADVAYAQQQLARMQKLFEAGAVSRAELEQAEAAAKTAQAQLEALGSLIREEQVQLAYYRVDAPAAGVVGEIPVRQGDRVTPSTEITTIDAAQGLEAYIQVPLERSAALRTGLDVELLDASGAVIGTERISFVAPRAGDATQSVLAKAAITRPMPGLRVQQYVRARVIWTNEPRLTVPMVAVSRIAGQYFLFTVQDGEQGTIARQTPVSVGELVEDEYIVTSGLKEGDRVVVTNMQKLMDGAPVAVQ